MCADCKDLDASCEAWANNGECDNNVAYMIGACGGGCRGVCEGL